MSGPPLGPEVDARTTPARRSRCGNGASRPRPTQPPSATTTAGGWRATTFREADAMAREIAAGLVARGVVPGDRICLVSQTRMEWVLCDVAILLAGGVTVPIYASNTAEQCEFIIRDAGAKIVIVEDESQRDKLLPLRDKLFTVTCLIQLVGELPVGLTPPPVGGRRRRGDVAALRAVAGRACARRASSGASRTRASWTPTARPWRPSRCSRSSTRRARPASPRASC